MRPSTLLPEPAARFAWRRRGSLVALLLATIGAAATAQDNTVGSRGPSTLVYPPYRHTYGIHKARTPHLKLFLGGRTVFAHPTGLAAVKLAQDDDPKIRVDDFQLSVFGLNAGRGEIIYNSSMQTLAIYGTHGSGRDQFDLPRGIAADVNGNVYVADTGNRRVVRLRWRERELGWEGTFPGEWEEPWAVATPPSGRAVYVSDRLTNQVYRWVPPDTSPTAGADAPPAQPLFSQGIDRPTALAVVDSGETWLQKRENALYVVYEDGARLGKFDDTGQLLASTAASDRTPIAAAPRFAYVATDFYGNVYVTDTANGTIYKFKSDLSFLTSYGEPGDGDYQLDEPRGIAIWKRFGQVLVAEREGAQYFFVGTDVRLPDGPLPIEVRNEGGTPRYAFQAFFTEPTELSLIFLAEGGAAIDSVALAEPVESGETTVTWSAAELAPDLPQRARRIVLSPRPTYSSRRRFVRRIEREIEWRLPS